MEFLRDVRLDRVRDELRSAPPELGIQVASVAAKYSFVYLGHFAAQYRARFGEVLSESLRGQRRHWMTGSGRRADRVSRVKKLPTVSTGVMGLSSSGLADSVPTKLPAPRSAAGGLLSLSRVWALLEWHALTAQVMATTSAEAPVM